MWRFWRRSLAGGASLWRPLHQPEGSTEAKPASQPAPLPPTSRERGHLPRHRAPDADEDPRKNPLQPMQPTRNTGTRCERLLLTRIAISGSLVSRDRTRKHSHGIVSGTPRNRSSEATSRTPSAPAEVTRVSVHAAAQRPTRTPPGTPLSSFRPTPRLETRGERSDQGSAPTTRANGYWPLQEPEVPSTAKKPCAGSNPRWAVLVTAVAGSDGGNTLFFTGRECVP
jgi:hypothetical protein